MDLVVGNSIWLTERQRENPSFVSLHKLWTTTILLVLLLVRPKFLYLSTNKAFNNHSSSFAQNRIICIASLPAREDDASVDLPPHPPELIFILSQFISVEKNCHVEKFQLSMCDNCGEIENFSTCGEISVQLIGFYCNLCRFVAKSVIHAVVSRNFCHNLCAFMWGKIEPKSTFVEKK